MRRRPTRPGVTAAATTAVFATGDGPGETALATTAVFATGWPMTPTRPTRAALRGTSVSFSCSCFIRLDGGDDRLNGNTAVRDQLATRTARRRRERRRPQVLPDEHARGAAGLHGSGKMNDVVRGQELGQLGLDGLKRPELRDIGKFGRVDRTVVVLGEDQDVDHADRLGVDERQQLRGHLAREVARSRRKLDDDVVDWTELIQRCAFLFAGSSELNRCSCHVRPSFVWRTCTFAPGWGPAPRHIEVVRSPLHT